MSRYGVCGIKLNLKTQYYMGLPLNLIHRQDYHRRKAKRFTINGSNQNVWIPNSYLEDDGTIKDGANITFIFTSEEGRRKLKRADCKDWLNVGEGEEYVVDVEKRNRKIAQEIKRKSKKYKCSIRVAYKQHTYDTIKRLVSLKEIYKILGVE